MGAAGKEKLLSEFLDKPRSKVSKCSICRDPELKAAVDQWRASVLEAETTGDIPCTRAEFTAFLREVWGYEHRDGAVGHHVRRCLGITRGR